MKIVSMEQIVGVLQRQARGRAVASGNFSPPLPLIAALDGTQETTLHMLNAQGRSPDRPGSPGALSCGPAMRNRRELGTSPADCRWLPAAVPIDGTGSGPLAPVGLWMARSSLGLEVNVLPTRDREPSRRWWPSHRMINPNMPYVTTATVRCCCASSTTWWVRRASKPWHLPTG